MTSSSQTNAPTSAKSAARLAAVQALYEMDVSDTPSGDVLAAFLSQRWQGRAEAEFAAENEEDDDVTSSSLTEPDRDFFSLLVEGVIKEKADIDPIIEAALNKGWTISRLEVLLRAILRAGTFELLSRADIPARAVISEYVDVAHAFFEDNEPGLVNGVLDKLARRLREGEFQDS